MMGELINGAIGLLMALYLLFELLITVLILYDINSAVKPAELKGCNLNQCIDAISGAYQININEMLINAGRGAKTWIWILVYPGSLIASIIASINYCLQNANRDTVL